MVVSPDQSEPILWPQSYSLWQKLALKALKGAGVDSLEHTTRDHFILKPIYPRAQNVQTMVHPDGVAAFEARCDIPDATQAFSQIKDDTSCGAQAIALIGSEGVGAYGFGLTHPEEVIAMLCDDDCVRDIQVRCDFNWRAASQGFHLLSGVEHGRAPSCVHLGYDPFASMALVGDYQPHWAVTSAKWLEIWLKTQVSSPVLRPQDTFWTVDGRIMHNTAATPAQELAYMVACGVSYLRMMQDQAIDIAIGSRWMLFVLSVDSDQLMGIAKLRAFRVIWSRVLEACGVERALPINLHVETSMRMMMTQDVHTNLMRTSIATLSALVGGAHHVSVLPFTQAVGLPDQQARRLARNTMIILRDEAHLNLVQDPSAGSGSIEALTHNLAQKAWQMFQNIEEEGGLFRSLQSGAFKERVSLARAQWLCSVQKGEEPRIGVDLYPPQHAHSVDVLAPYIRDDDTHNRCFENGFYPVMRPDQALKSDALSVSS